MGIMFDPPMVHFQAMAWLVIQTFCIQMVIWKPVYYSDACYHVTNHLNSEQVKVHSLNVCYHCTVGIWNLSKSGFCMVKKRLGCKWSGLWIGSEIWNSNHLKSGKWRPFCQKPFEIQTLTDFKWSGFQMVGAIGKAWPFENCTIWNQTFKKSGFQMFPYFKWLDFRFPL